MNGETNGNNLDGTNYNGEPEIDLENAFSDLIAEFFEEGNKAEAANGADVGTTENVTANETNNILYSNLEGIKAGEDNGNVEESADGIGVIDTGTEVETATNKIYGKLGDITSETTIHNAYGVITFNESVNNIVNGTGTTEETTGTGVGGGVDTKNGVGNGIEKNKNFKLTQGNLPAKIGFWTKLRNFFIPESKLQYSVQENNNEGTGILNKLQNLFSFGKEK